MTEARTRERASRLRRFLEDPDLPAAAAARVLRGAFLAFFAGQGVVALLVAAVVAILAGVRPRPTAWVGAVVVAASLGQFLVGVAVTVAGVRSAGVAAGRLAAERAELPPADIDPTEARRAFAGRLRAARSSALWAAVMASVMLSTPAWFAAFALLSGNRGAALAGVVAILAAGYGFGFLQLGPLARGVRVERRPRSGVVDPDATAGPRRADPHEETP